MKLPDYPPAMTREQVAEVLQVSASSVWDLIQRDEIPAFKVGRRLRIPRSAIEALLTVGDVEDDGEDQQEGQVVPLHNRTDNERQETA